MCAATVVEETRAERVVGAAGRVSELVVGGWARPRVFWVLGPNFDSSFWYRTTGNENRLDVGNYKSYGRLEAEATAPCPAIGKPVIPRFEDMHEVERSLVCMASYISRAKVMADLVKTTIPVAVPVTRSLTSDNDPVDGRLKGLITSVNTNMHMFRLTCGALVIKHFPAAPGPIQETGELQLAKLDIPLHQLLHWQLPFTDNFHCSLPASSVMMSHTCFTVAEQELRQIENDLGCPYIKYTWATTRCAELPASLSPYMIRGLLRRYHGFRGITVTDWTCMGAIYQFTTNTSNFPEDMSTLSPMTRLAICAVEAGINFCLGYKVPELGLCVPEVVVTEIEEYSRTHAYWPALLNELVDHSLWWCKAGGAVMYPKNWIPPAAESLGLADKLGFYFGFNSTNDLLRPAQNRVNTENYEDVCFRGGVFTALLRYYYVTSDPGTSPAIHKDCDPRLFKTTKLWLTAIRNHSGFIAAYGAIDWHTVYEEFAPPNQQPVTVTASLNTLIDTVMNSARACATPQLPFF